MQNEALIEKLNHALNREVTTFLGYLVQSSLIKGAQWDSVRTMYQTEVLDEVGHAQYLAVKIVMLGGVPKLAPDLAAPPATVEEMLKNDIQEEQADVQGYMELAKLAEEEGMPELRMRMEDQAADEAGHAELMTRMLAN